MNTPGTLANTLACCAIVLGVIAALVYIDRGGDEGGERFWGLVEAGYGLLVFFIVVITVIALINVII